MFYKGDWMLSRLRLNIRWTLQNMILVPLSTARVVVLRKEGLRYYSAVKLLIGLIIIALVLSGAIFSLGWSVGFGEGFETGRKEVNQWWVDQKSTSYETNKILNERYLKGFDCA